MISFKCLASGSSGNCYLLQNNKECLILEAGINPKNISKYINSNVEIGTIFVVIRMKKPNNNNNNNTEENETNYT